MSGISESRFNMWRAVVAMIHADDVVKPHEIHFIIENTKNLALSEEQRGILANDIRQPADIQSLFRGIESRRDKEDFFHLARAISWSDGEFDEDEEAAIKQMRLLSMEVKDKEILRSSLRDFQEVYVKGQDKGSDPGFFYMIKGLMGARAA